MLATLGFPPPQQNAMCALTLLALLDLRPTMAWTAASNPTRGVSPILDFVNTHYGTTYQENTRETFRKNAIHSFEEAGLIVKNPGHPDRPTNSPRTVYQIAPLALDLIRTYGTDRWDDHLAGYLETAGSLAERYAKRRQMTRVPLQMRTSQPLSLSPGAHSDLIIEVIYSFGPRFTPDGTLIYAGDTASKWGSYFDRMTLAELGVVIPSRGTKIPDVVIHHQTRQWLVLVEAFTSRGPIDSLRRAQLQRIFAGFGPDLVFVTAFPDRRTMARQAGSLAWETDAWCADHPDHLIHFNGERFLGPY